MAKYTDEQIKKALERCKRGKLNDCTGCPCFKDDGISTTDCMERLLSNALDLINRQEAEIAEEKAKKEIAAEVIKRQEAEIERLKNRNARDDEQHKFCNLLGDVRVYSKTLEDYNRFRVDMKNMGKSETIKEFAERLKEKAYPYPYYQHSHWNYDTQNRHISIPDGYSLNQGNSYEWVETDNGYDIIIHFVKE